MRSRATDLIIAEILKTERLKAGFTQERLAAGLGTPQSFVAKLENGERRLLMSDAVSIARILGIDLAKFCQEFSSRVQ